MAQFKHTVTLKLSVKDSLSRADIVYGPFLTPAGSPSFDDDRSDGPSRRLHRRMLHYSQEGRDGAPVRSDGDIGGRIMREDLLGQESALRVIKIELDRDKHSRAPSGFARLADRLSRAHRRSKAHLRRQY